MSPLEVVELRKKAHPFTGELIQWFAERKITDDPIIVLFVLAQALRLAIEVIEQTDSAAAQSATRIIISEITR